MYCPLALSLAAATHRKNLQRVQNNSLRWIHDVKWDDFIPVSILHEETKNIPALNILWATHTHRQFTRLNTWCEDWAEALRRLAQTGRWRREGIARNLLEIDYQTEAEADPEY